MSKATVKSTHGNTFQIDTSEQACQQFGVKHNQTIFCKRTHRNGIVCGVARNNEHIKRGQQVLWCTFDSTHVESISHKQMTHITQV